MSAVKINHTDLPVGKSLPFDLINVTGALIIPKNSIITAELLSKLENVDLYVESIKSARTEIDLEGEGKALITNSTFDMGLGKDVESFYLFQRETSGYTLIKCEWVGWIKKLAFVIEMPRQGNAEFAKLLQLNPGQKIQAKMHVGNNEYIFHSFVISVANNPVPLAFIKHPATVKTIRLRSANRKMVCLDGFINIDGFDHEVTIVDISDSGAAFTSDLIIDKSKEFSIIIHFKINESMQTLSIPVKIRNQRGLGTKHRYGVSYEGQMLVKDKIFLQSFIYTL